VALATFALALVFAAVAAAGTGTASSGGVKAFVEPSLLSSAEQSPGQSFDVIVEGSKWGNSNGLYKKLVGDSAFAGTVAQIRQKFNSIDGLHASLTGKQILSLANRPYVTAIVANEGATASAAGGLPAMNPQLWPWVSGVPLDWVGSKNLSLPTIAIVDSGIDLTRGGDFGNRVLGQVNLASLTPNSPGDGYGHGTFVAGIAAGQAAGQVGVSPRSNLVSLDVMNDQGESTVADIIGACDWILANKTADNIKVANFSLHAVNQASVLFDPLDQAVEKLWLNGVTVVTAAGNYATNGQESGVPYAPGNDPFVITVGAADTNNTLSTADDVVAPWSAWGYTGDGFLKPDLSAPGRYIIGPVSPNAALYTLRPGDVVSPGYMQLSGTSFSAPMVAGAAAELIAQHPAWTPDQVKGALMVSADPTPAAAAGSLGVGELDVAHARKITGPPNPNASLDHYLTIDTSGNTIFNAAAWQTAALTNPAWNTAAWSDAAWASAAWSSAAWSSAAWASAAWASAAWGTAAWASAAWASAAWSDAAWADNSTGDPTIDPTSTDATTNDITAAAANLGIDPNCDPTTSDCLLADTPTTTTP
jgi:serine protease AprX